MTLFKKIKWISGVSLIFILIITTNLIDQSNFQRLRESVITIYEDKLIAKGVLIEISSLLQDKEIALVMSDSAFFLKRNEPVNASIEKLIVKYEGTIMTKEESEIVNNLKDDFSSLKEYEEKFLKEKSVAKETLYQEVRDTREKLQRLSEIQLEEGRKQLFISKQAMDSIDLFTKVEIYFLIFLGIIIITIIIYDPNKNKVSNA